MRPGHAFPITTLPTTLPFGIGERILSRYNANPLQDLLSGVRLNPNTYPTTGTLRVFGQEVQLLEEFGQFNKSESNAGTGGVSVQLTPLLLSESAGATAQSIARVWNIESQTRPTPIRETVETVICRFGTLSQFYDATGIVQRIAELESFSIEEGFSISIGSLKQFLRFIDANLWLASPDIIISALGNIRCQWNASPSQHLVIEFFSSGEIRYVVFAPNRAHAEITSRASGTSTQDLVLEILSPFDIRSWCTHG